MGLDSRQLRAVNATAGLLEAALPTAAPHYLLDEIADVQIHKHKSSAIRCCPHFHLAHSVTGNNKWAAHLIVHLF